MFLSRGAAALRMLVFFQMAVVVLAQGSFNWGFTSSLGTATSLQECAKLALAVYNATDNPNPAPKPPFYMIAYPPNGIPDVQQIGMNQSNLSWTVKYSSGMSLLIQVVDSNGVSAGVDTPIYKVTTGSSTSCHQTNITSPITVKTSQTSLKTCDPLILDITGGDPPYDVSIIVQNSAGAFNATLGGDDNRYTWYDVAIPTDAPLLLAAVSDSKGRYGVTTSFISLSGSVDTSCTGKISGGSQTPSNQTSGGSTGNNDTSNSGSNKTAIIVGASVGGAVALLLVILLLFFLVGRRSKRVVDLTDERASKENVSGVDPYWLPDEVPHRPPYLSGTSSNNASSHHIQQNGGPVTVHPPSPTPQPQDTDGFDPHFLYQGPGGTTIPTSPGKRKKMLSNTTLQLDTAASPTSASTSIPSESSAGQLTVPTAAVAAAHEERPPGAAAPRARRSNYIVHRDGGPVVAESEEVTTEVPPAYGDIKR